MNEVGLVEAWGKWASGELAEEALLWGMSILWWGRIGKLTGFAAALAIIAEIIGPERLRAFGDSMHRMIAPRRCLGFTVEVWRWMKLYAVRFVSKGAKEAKLTAEMEASKVNALIGWPCVLVFFGTWAGAVIVAFSEDEWYVGVLRIVMYCVPILFLSTLLCFVTVPVVAVSLCSGGLFLAMVDVLVIEPSAWLLERKQLDKLIKLGSVVLLILGFHFDLLAS
jgi:hypothetical protein